MQTNPLRALFQIPLDRPDLPPIERNAYRTNAAFLLYTPIMLGFGSIGFVLIYMVALFGLLDYADPRLLILAGIMVLFGLAHLPLLSYLRQGNTEIVSLGLLLTSILSGAVQVFMWAGIVWFPLSIIIFPSLSFLYQQNVRGRYKLLGLLLGLFAAVTVLYVDGIIAYPRMSFAYLSDIAGFTMYLTAITALIVLGIMNGTVPFRSISSRLITTFLFVTILSTISTLVVSSLASFYQDQQLEFNQLKTISYLKESRIEAALSDLSQDLNIAMQDSTLEQHINFLLSSPANSLIQQFNYELALANLTKLQQQHPSFEEILILDNNGKAVLSTLKANANRDFSQRPFIHQTLNGQIFSLETNFPGASDDISLIMVRPVTVNGVLLGMLVIRSNLNAIREVMETRVGLANTMETYLVATIDGKNVPLTKTLGNATEINTTATSTHNEGFGTYNNYQGASVLGYYTWIPDLGVFLVAEVGQERTTASILTLFFTNIFVGLFTAILGFAIVYITSQSISNPIKDLAQKANSLATGEMETRILIYREDELGDLSSSFNTMAEQLKNLVRTLEEKVEDRTRGLQAQANRVLLAAEIARDAAALGDLDELLDRSSKLVLDRFDFYHTGIFLVDPQREYAVLRASPTEAGRQMLAQNHRLRIGKEGIVGNVALTGESQVVEDTSLDVNYFDNPLLPKTRSELVLPLKVQAHVIGILDVQSQEPNAFSEDDIAILQIMADQLALAIERVQLVEQLESRLSELEHASQEFTATSWRSFTQETEFKPGYSFDGVKLLPIDSYPAWSQDTLRDGRSVVLSGKSTGAKDSLLAVPLKLRDQIIGVMNIRFSGDTLNAETINLSEEIANRLAVALENARLYTETQKLAERERTVGEISNRITTSINIENILRTAVQELGRLNPDTEVVVQLQEEKEE